MTPALGAEALKARLSVVVGSASALIVGGILALCTAMTLAADRGNQQVLAKLGPLAEETGWSRLTGMAAMVGAAAAFLGFGVVLSWMIGREFADETVEGLFAIPVTRRATATAKIAVFGCWAATVAAALTAGCFALGVALGYGTPSSDEAVGLTRLLAVVFLTGLLALPAGLASTLGRGLLPGVATTVVLIALGQIVVVAGSGAWFPLAAPAIWAVSADEVSALQLGLVPLPALLAASLTVRAWERLELDR